MERILRSVIQVADFPVEEDAKNNWLRLSEYNIGFHSEEDRKIYEYLKMFYEQMSSPPDIAIVREYFEKKDDIDVVARISELAKAQYYIRQNFLSIVKAEQEAQSTKEFILLCRDAAGIAEHGKNLERPVEGRKVIRGVVDAVNYMGNKLSDFIKAETGERLEGIIASDGDAADVIDEYEHDKKGNMFARRNLLGLEPVDAVCRGHRSGEFWVHAAFAGELKSSLSLNMVYNNTYVYGKNMFYAFLEMRFRAIRHQLYCLHSSNGKFISDWHEQDIKAGRQNPYMGVDYRRLRDCELTPIEEERFKIVAQDYEATCKGKLKVWRPATDGVLVSDVKRHAELFNNKHECHGVIIDYMGLLKSRSRATDTTAIQNAVVTECKWMAMNFARGRTIPVFGLYQMNRQGKERADKNNGRYDISSISYANQIERDADVITYTYLNEQLRKEGKFYMGCLKNRDNPIFERMIGKILWSTKRMRAIESTILDLTPEAVVNNCNNMVPKEEKLDPNSLI